jgi:hypothetical protein
VRGESLPTLTATGDMFWLLLWTLWAASSAVFLTWSVYSGYKKSSWWWGISFVGSSIVAAFFFRRLV